VKGMNGEDTIKVDNAEFVVKREFDDEAGSLIEAIANYVFSSTDEAY
jgi:hypothetical protein